MDQLPVEIIENILVSNNLSIPDIINFSSTCTYFRNIVVNNQTIWKKVIYNNWPDSIQFTTEYFEEIQYIFQLKNRSQMLLEIMPSRFHKKFALSETDLEDWKILLMEKEQNYFYLTKYLMEICNTNVPINSIEIVPLNTPGNKTTQYYAINALRFIQHIHLTKIWNNFISQPEKNQILEKGAVFVAQWMEPSCNITQQNISNQLDQMAEAVKQCLYLSFPNHPLFRTAPEVLNTWRITKLDGNQWSIPDCRQIIATMREVIYLELGFSGNNESYYSPDNSLINKVLETKRGLPITLAIIYESVGRRLGLVFEPISFPSHFLLRFTENPNGVWYYIDVFNEGNIVVKSACPRRQPQASRTLFEAATCVQVVERMANNIELSIRQHTEHSRRLTRLKSVLELLKVINPQNLTPVLTLSKLYMMHDMDTRSLEQHLTSQTFNFPLQAERILHMLRDYTDHRQQNEVSNTIVPKQRTPEIMYAVGMIMRHGVLNYNCVIYDWDPRCLATPDWQYDMHVNELVSKSEQPFYHVLTDDGTYRYVAQESFAAVTCKNFSTPNDELGKHFSHFFENHFVPNAEKEKKYPEDAKVRHKFYHEMILKKYHFLI